MRARQQTKGFLPTRVQVLFFDAGLLAKPTVTAAQKLTTASIVGLLLMAFTMMCAAGEAQQML